MFHASEETTKTDRLALCKRLGLDDQPERKLWLCISRLAPEKDIGELLRGLKQHLQEKEKQNDQSLPPLLVIAGDGPCRSSLEEQVRKDDLPVRFLGMVAHTEVASLYRACDVCCTNSVHETFGLTIIESLSCGCPMVMPHCDVFDELYGDVLGDWMYKKGDVDSLSRAMVAGATTDARDHLATLRRNQGFNPNLFWSWQDAATEQMAQYERCKGLIQVKSRWWNVVVKNMLVAIAVLTMCCVLIVDGR